MCGFDAVIYCLGTSTMLVFEKDLVGFRQHEVAIDRLPLEHDTPGVQLLHANLTQDLHTLPTVNWIRDFGVRWPGLRFSVKNAHRPNAGSPVIYITGRLARPVFDSWRTVERARHIPARCYCHWGKMKADRCEEGGPCGQRGLA